MSPRFAPMSEARSKAPALTALIGSLLGLVFSYNSTIDYAAHLDRRLHDVHCSFIPGAPATAEAEACRAAMYSPYSAIMRDSLWGGIPISLFALGAFAFFAAFSVYLLLAKEKASRVNVMLFATVSVTPLLVSIVMFTISVTKLGTLCKTCVGTYIASALLATGGLLSLKSLKTQTEGVSRPFGQPLSAVFWFIVLGVVTLLPTLVYAAAAPDQRPYLGKCGELKKPEEPSGALIRFRGARAVQPALLFEDPLCPTCKALHERLLGEGVLERLDVTLSLFPLDSNCNWMLSDNSLHPGACVVARAIICAKGQERQMLEWAFAEQESLAAAGKMGEQAIKSRISQRWGSSILSCIDGRDAKATLNKHLHFAAENNVPVSTPQVFLGKQRLCDEDTDLGLRFTLKQLAPEVLQ
jgi:uncharacterized membrane protein